MLACNQLDLQILGSQPAMHKNLPDHSLEAMWRFEQRTFYIGSLRGSHSFFQHMHLKLTKHGRFCNINQGDFWA